MELSQISCKADVSCTTDEENSAACAAPDELELEQLTLEESSAPVPHQKDIQDKENVLLPPHDMEMTMAYPTNVTMNVPVIPNLCGTKMEKLPPQPPAPVQVNCVDKVEQLTLEQSSALSASHQKGARWEQFYIVLSECFL